MIQESIHTCSDIVHYNCMSSSRSMRVSRYAIRATTPHHGYAGVQFALRHTGGNLATHDNCGLSVTGFSSRAECEGVAARSWLRRYVVESTVRGWCETDSGTGILHGSNRILSLAHFAMLFWAQQAAIEQGHQQLRLSFLRTTITERRIGSPHDSSRHVFCSQNILGPGC